ncbi:putative uridine nucleosidase 2 [Bienertia sinuspersici]
MGETWGIQPRKMAEGEPRKKKLIIDTDPGIDDAMAIFVALQSPEVEVIGLTTIYGNVYTTLATRNALHLLEVAERSDIPVAEGSHVTITKGTKLRIADFVHGADGLGNQNFPPPKGKPIEQSAADFLVEQANKYPGEVTLVALGPLTNVALAIQLDPEFAKNIGNIVILGGAFAVNGNVNPAAEANVRHVFLVAVESKSIQFLVIQILQILSSLVELTFLLLD